MGEFNHPPSTRGNPMLTFADENDDEGFQLVPERSYVEGVLDATAPERMRWSIRLEWFNPDLREHSFRQAHLEIDDLDFGTGDWRQLAGKEATAVYAEDAVHPILPDNPGNFLYCGEHHVPNHNRIRIVERHGPDLTLTWNCRA